MAKALVIVESPAKVKTIGKYLGNQYIVKASLGHIKDLPKKDLAVAVESDFRPDYQIIEGKKKLITELKQAAKKVESIYLAADPDREGEAICFHLQEELDGSKGGPRIYRVMFNEITQNAIRKAFETPLTVNVNLVEAQQARRVLDRLVGYKISPLLWDKVRASKDVAAHLIGTIGTPQKFEERRQHMADAVWTKMKATDSRECRSCHDFAHMDLLEQRASARKYHTVAMKEGATCIDCHKGIAHFLPVANEASAGASKLLEAARAVPAGAKQLYAVQTTPLRTRDGSLAAHFEHTVALTASGTVVLTARNGSNGVAR